MLFVGRFEEVGPHHIPNICPIHQVDTDKTAAVSRANGSVGPIGAKLSNDRADSAGAGERDVVVEGDPWLFSAAGRSNAPAGKSKVDLGKRGMPRIGGEERGFAADLGDNGSIFAMGFASSFSRKRE